MIGETVELANKNIPIAINPQILWWGFAIIAILTIIGSVVLLYHWITYGYKPITTSTTGTVYFMGAILLLSMMFFAAVSFTASL